MFPDISCLLRQADDCLNRQGLGAKRLIRVYALVFAVAVIGVNLLSFGLLEASDSMTGLYRAAERNRLMVLNLGITLVVELALLLWRAGYSGAVLELSRDGETHWRHMLWALYQPHRFALCGLLLFVRWLLLSYVLSFVAMMVVPAESLFVGEFISPGAYYGLIGIMMAVLAILIFNRRLLFFCLADHQDRPALLAYREAIQLLRGHRRWFLRIDLRFWWYYLAQGILLLLPYATAFLPETFSAWFTVIDLGAMILCAVAVLGLELCCRNRIWVTYAMAYDAVLREGEMVKESALLEGKS